MSPNPPSSEQRLAAREKPQGLPVMRPRWAGLLFLHWPIDAAMLVERLPRGLHVDTFGGAAWLGVVPFFTQRVRPVGLPPLPGISWFLELNVRTYVHDDAGNPGVWFFSLDCNQALAVKIARHAFHLPYFHAEINAETSGNAVDYTCRRKTPCAGEAVFHYETPINPRPAAEGSLEWFLVERYRLFSADCKERLFCGQVHHAPYQIAPAACSQWSSEPLRLDGISLPEQAPSSSLAAAPVDVSVYPLRRC